jgi:hypothetical protein
MARQPIGIGTIANDGTGDPLRDAFDKINDNFIELYDDDANDVNSVNGQTGTVILDTDDIGEGATNKYDKTVVLTEGDNVTITGTYPNFTISSNDVVGEVSSVSAGDGISVNSTTGNVIVTNTITNNNQLTNGAGYVDGSGTANYIPKWTDGDTIGNSVIYDNGTNIGIGTNNPSQLLHVTDGSGGEIAIGTNTSALKTLMFGVNNDYSIQSNGGSYLRIYTEGSERMRVYDTGDISFRDTSNNEAFYWDASTARLGIGTTSPEQQMHIEGTSLTVNRANADSSVAFKNSASNATWRIGRDYSNSEALTFAYSASDYPSLTASGVAVIDSSGNVGIGTTSPAYTLDVNGTPAKFTRGGKGILLNGNYANANTHSSIQVDAGMGLSVDISGFGEAMRISSAGNVGIGISNPDSYWSQANRLVLGGTGNMGLTIKSTTTGNGRIVFTDTVGATAGLNDGGMIHYDHTSDSMRLHANGTERMRIDSSGNVGIGITSTTSFDGIPRLILGKASSDSGIAIFTGSTNSGYLQFADGTSGAEEYRGFIKYDHSSNSMSFNTNSAGRSESKMIITSSCYGL